eukprot:3320728-Ditylum_brightwellii.AAC.1
MISALPSLVPGLKHRVDNSSPSNLSQDTPREHHRILGLFPSTFGFELGQVKPRARLPDSYKSYAKNM